MKPGEAIVRQRNGEAHRYDVVSRSGQCDGHLVDLDEFGGYGQCGCQDFEFRMQPILSRNPSKEEVEKLEPCWHIRMARRFQREQAVMAALAWADSHADKQAGMALDAMRVLAGEVRRLREVMARRPGATK